MKTSISVISETIVNPATDEFSLDTPSTPFSLNSITKCLIQALQKFVSTDKNNSFLVRAIGKKIDLNGKYHLCSRITVELEESDQLNLLQNQVKAIWSQFFPIVRGLPDKIDKLLEISGGQPEKIRIVVDGENIPQEQFSVSNHTEKYLLDQLRSLTTLKTPAVKLLIGDCEIIQIPIEQLARTSREILSQDRVEISGVVDGFSNKSHQIFIKTNAGPVVVIQMHDNYANFKETAINSAQKNETLTIIVDKGVEYKAGDFSIKEYQFYDVKEPRK
jgi:hypothetical protein